MAKSNAGKLSERITFQSYTLASDGAGGQVKTWANLATTPTVWAHVKSRAGQERFDEDRDTASAITEFTIRNRSDVDETMRIVWGGENYNIRHVMREGTRAMYLYIKSERGV